MKPSIGFENLNEIKPDRDLQKIDTAKTDAVAEENGFPSREGTIFKDFSVRNNEPMKPLSLRLPPSEYNRFGAFKSKNKYSYHEAIKALLDLAGIDDNGDVRHDKK